MSYYLTQRLETNTMPRGSETGFDRLFNLDYMGSSEFEWGAIPKALKAMREKPTTLEAHPITIGELTRDVFFVGHVGTLQDAAEEFRVWASDASPRGAFWGKELTGFPEKFAGRSTYMRADAWWAIESCVAFALNEATALRLVEAFNNKPSGT